MTTRIVRVGNTLTVEIPEALLVQASIPVGEPLEWISNGNGSLALVARHPAPSELARRRKTLEELLDGVEEHSPLGELDWGASRGVEGW
jgi:antitoxin component of MazEF toxin-antitoxin module